MLQSYFLSMKKCLLDQHKELHKIQDKNQKILQVGVVAIYELM